MVEIGKYIMDYIPWLSTCTGKWYNQCKFTCKACPEEKYFTVPQALRMHLNGIHSMTRKVGTRARRRENTWSLNS